jgi:hypothetical protein
MLALFAMQVLDVNLQQAGNHLQCQSWQLPMTPALTNCQCWHPFGNAGVGHHYNTGTSRNTVSAGSNCDASANSRTAGIGC